MQHHDELPPPQLTDVIVSEVLRGADGTDICCGVIGEIGTSWPITDSEKKVLQAAAHAQTQLGCPVIIHPGRNSKAPGAVVQILQEAGGDISKTVMSHLDRYTINPNAVEERGARVKCLACFKMEETVFSMIWGERAQNPCFV